MITKILPLVLLFVGTGAGVGAGIFLRPAPAADTPAEDHAKSGAKADIEERGAEKKSSKKKTDGRDDPSDAGDSEFVKMNNQFVVPIVSDGRVTALVVLGLSIQVPNGKTEGVYKRQPKLRDSFLQVLFDHANMGGFEGEFTDAQMLGRLREALREVAQRDIGEDTVRDVLIVEIARQDY